ncbi:MAG: hypothetical protein ABJP70_07650 [Erythrobacter sp.]
MLDIGNVFSNTFNMMKERWLALLGLWAVFFGLLIVYALIAFAVLGGAATAMMGGISDPSAASLGSMGIGIIIMGVIFYIGYFAIAFGQQGSMVAMASPLKRISFGDALGIGIKGGLTFLGVLVLLLIAYVAFAIIAVILGFILSFLGEAAAVILAILILPAIIYLLCRFAVLVPVIVVERIFNPITAITRCWAVTRGHVLGILVVIIITVVIAAIMIGVPFMLFFGALFATADPANFNAGSAIGGAVFGMLIFFLMYLLYMIFSASLIASLHAQISDADTVDLGKTFE